MREIPNLKIIGRGSEEEKTKLEEHVENKLKMGRELLPKKDLEALKAREYPKGEVELAAIKFANEYTASLMQQAGISNFDIPADNYYIVPSEDYIKHCGTDSVGMAYGSKKTIVLNGSKCRNKPLFISNLILHETVHLKSFLKFELNENHKMEKRNLFRSGLSVLSSEKKDKENGYPHYHFSGLNEAVVAGIERRALAKMMKLPEIQAEIARLNSSEILEDRQKLANIMKVPVEEIIWLSDNDLDYETSSNLRISPVLEYICAEIQKEFSDKYADADAVFQEFSNALFNGNLLTIAKLVEKTFGKESFRILGNMIVEDNSAALTLETFKRLRLKQADN